VIAPSGKIDVTNNVGGMIDLLKDATNNVSGMIDSLKDATNNVGGVLHPLNGAFHKVGDQPNFGGELGFKRA
jgi:hypothetical protein